MTNEHEIKIREDHIAYWRQRAELAERHLDETRALVAQSHALPLETGRWQMLVEHYQPSPSQPQHMLPDADGTGVGSVGCSAGEITVEDIKRKLALTDTELASALRVSVSSVRNWRRTCVLPPLVQMALCWMMELRRLSPENHSLPSGVRKEPA